MQRIFKCDGLFAEKRSPDGKPEDVTPKDVSEMKALVNANRTLTTPFDIVVSGKTNNLANSQRKDVILPWLEAGATWWIEGLWGESQEAITERIRQGPPILE
jgi:hypothetical protein